MPKSAESEKRVRKENQKHGGGKAEVITALICQSFELFHTHDRVAYASDGKDLWRIDSTEFKLKVLYLLHCCEQPVSESTLKHAINKVQSIALFKCPEHSIDIRVAQYDNGPDEHFIYLDLADGTGRVVEVTAKGWQVIDKAPVRFMRPPSMLPLPEPARDGSVEDLRRLINIGTGPDADCTWVLILAWLVGVFQPRGTCAVLSLHGEQGSAKTTLSRMLRGLVDPSLASVGAQPHNEHDLAIGAEHNWIVAFDNISHIPEWLSDAICRLTNGSTTAKRKLYTGREEELFTAKRPIILNGIGESTTRSDLLDRAVLINLPKIRAEERKTEKDLWAAFKKCHPGMLGALLDAVSTALRKESTIELQLKERPRMADFATWAVAAGSGLGFDPDFFMDAYRKNRDVANTLALESSALYLTIVAYVEAKHWMILPMTASLFLAELNRFADEATRKQRGWPRGANTFTFALRRIAPNLRNIGIDVELRRTREGCLVSLRRVEPDANNAEPQIMDVGPAAASKAEG